MTESDAKYRLGLDLGTNSIGWAAVKLEGDGEPCGVLDMGVRVFPDGRNPRDGSSNAVQRRVPRGQRRRRDRYLKRRTELVRKLDEFGMGFDLPSDRRDWPSDKDGRKEKAGRLDPYVLRARALDHPLEPHELGRVLFHLDQRRGFKSNRKAGGEDESEAKTTRARHLQIIADGRSGRNRNTSLCAPDTIRGALHDERIALSIRGSGALCPLVAPYWRPSG